LNNYKIDLRTLNKHWRKLLYSRIQNLFEYEGLPEEINQSAFKLWLWVFGKVIFYKIKDKYLVQPFSYTDRLDWYYVPLHGRVVNPWLPTGFQNYEFTVDDEAIIWSTTPDIYNFKEKSLVSDLVFKTATQLAENDTSFYCVQRNSRLIAIFTAENDLEKAECNRILEKMYNGEADITMQEDLVSHISANPISENSQRGRITELIEFQQYILANFYHSFGINSNYNLKREQLNSAEIDVNKDVLRLNIEDMLRSREKGVSKINEKYGLNIRVSLNEEVYKNLIEEAQDITAVASGISAGKPKEMGKGAEQMAEDSSEAGTDNSPNNELDTGSEDTNGDVRSNSETDEEVQENNETQDSIPDENGETSDITINIAINGSNLCNNEEGDENNASGELHQEHNTETVERETPDD